MTSDLGPAPEGVAASAPDGDVWVITLSGSFDLESIEGVERAADRALRSFAGPLVYDLGEVTFCDSALLNHLLGTVRTRPVGLVAPRTSVKRLLEITGTGGVLPHYPDLDAARAGLGAA
ncbi:STAS domain-containing protein [Streptomyces sp. TG1A-8]|uniref:STAS domain-containing protein n=1 Tax=Streptomyces sp. TG1A-8 TaxID=3051385 RepID=UPI00265BD107|nr:STAS domain-containing protein [Streptomyces sp. TG1A-8]MDO0924313.1 STAS domain-containing protein [Streptomyces sp. TG1A-8]